MVAREAPEAAARSAGPSSALVNGVSPVVGRDGGTPAEFATGPAARCHLARKRRRRLRVRRDAYSLQRRGADFPGQRPLIEVCATVTSKRRSATAEFV